MMLDLPMSHEAALSRMKEWGIAFDHFFDIGAARGMWGKMIRSHWPDAAIHFFEAAPPWKPELESAAAALGGRAEVTIAAVGDAEGEAFFRYDPDNPYGGAILDRPAENAISVPKVRLDDYFASKDIRGRCALKLDVHGAERLILSGATEFMKSCDFVIFETYNFGPAHRRFGQMAVFLEEEFKLRCIDLVEPKWRRYDGALWQLDLYFARPEGTRLEEWRL